MSTGTKLLTGGLVLLCLPVLLIGAAAGGLSPTFTRSAPALCLAAGGTETEGGRHRLDSEQRRNARLIVRVSAEMGLPPRAAVIAIAAAYQESRLRNLNRGHLDSLGLFQQRPSAGWGSPQQILNPRYAARQFYTALTDVPGWRRLPVAEAAQAVQRSAYPDAYARWTGLARRTVTSAAGGSCLGGPGRDGTWPEEEMLPMGLTPRTLRVKQLVERRFSEHDIGGYCPGGCTTGHIEDSDHYDGHAIDIIITPYTDPDRAAKGWTIARWLVTHHQPLAIKYVIYRRKIWTPDQGWHPYTHPSGNSSPSLAHLNHLHVSVR